MSSVARLWARPEFPSQNGELPFAGGQLDGAILEIKYSGSTCYPLANAQAFALVGLPVHLPPATAVWTRARVQGRIILPKPFDFEAVKSALAALLGKTPRVSATS